MDHEHRRKIERILYSYPALLAAVESDNPNLFGSGGELENKQLKVEAIKRGLDALTYTERDLIQQKYFNPAQPKDAEVSETINVGTTTYYKFKEQALHKVAIALNII